MALILVILVLAAPVTARNTPETSEAFVTQLTPASPPPAPAKVKKTPPGNPSTKPPGKHSFISWAYWQQGGTNTSRSEIARNFLLVLAAFVGLGFGIWRAWTAHRQATVAEQGLITDRFSTAAEHLGSAELPVRMGGIYALWRLAGDSPERDVIIAIDILCAFVRNPPHEPPRPPDPATENGDPESENDVQPTVPLRPDVQTVLDLIGGKTADYRGRLPADYRLDFTGANLMHAVLVGTDLTSANLWRANLMKADLTGAKLADAYFGAARLDGAYFGGADLRDTNLSHAIGQYVNLSMADLTGANLTGVLFINAYLVNADLTKADLTGADLTSADLTGAKLTHAFIKEAAFRNANLREADLTGAYLRGANLLRANIMNADLKDANLSSANISGADFTEARNLTQAQLAKAVFDPDLPPDLPPELVLPGLPPADD